VDDRNALLRELMAIFDQLPSALREAINYAPEPLDPRRSPRCAGGMAPTMSWR
jgi:hypothetical protein